MQAKGWRDERGPHSKWRMRRQVHPHILAIVERPFTIELRQQPRTQIAHFSIISAVTTSVSTTPQDGHRCRIALRHTGRAGNFHRSQGVFQSAIGCDCRCCWRRGRTPAIAVQERAREAEDPSSTVVELGRSRIRSRRAALCAFALGRSNRASAGLGRSGQFCGKQCDYFAGVSRAGRKIGICRSGGAASGAICLLNPGAYGQRLALSSQPATRAG